MGMVLISPACELADLEAIAVLSRLAAGAAALTDKAFDQQRIAPEDSTCFCGIKKTADVGGRAPDIKHNQQSFKTV